MVDSGRNLDKTVTPSDALVTTCSLCKISYETVFMHELTSIGEVPWSRDELVAALEEFSHIYRERPIADNSGGMTSSHLFPTWFGLKRLRPKAVVESGIWYGQGTWLIERACPEAELYCIDVKLDRIRYRSKRARYFDRDFSTLDWSGLPKSETVLFFDDHQNAYERLKSAKWFGFRDVYFEDNYPPGQGDCYSLKRVFAHAGFQPPQRRPTTAAARWKARVRRLLGVHDVAPGGILPNSVDEAALRANLAVYYEFPPIFRPDRTRWGDAWTDDRYPTPPALLDRVAADYQQVFFDEAQGYTWICYARLN